jgi:ketosteroid isomerase-like protein
LLDQDDAWDEWRQELREVIDTSGDSVVVEARLVARGKHSSVPVDQSFGVVVTLHEGRITSTRAFVSVDAALEAVGRET